MHESSPLISIIALNYNQLQVTCEFLDSLGTLTYPNIEVIVVDNASTEDPEPHIRLHYPEVILIKSQRNLGFTGGNNLGIRAAKGMYYFIVNNDTEVTPDMLEKLLEPFSTDDAIGVVCPKIRYHSNPEMIQYAGFTEINPFTGRNRSVGGNEIDKGQHDTPGYTAYAHGAAMLVKREVVEKVGMMPEIYFIYYEELDWSAQIRRSGYNIYYQPKAVIFHKASVTMGRESANRAYYFNRNRVLFMRRNTNAIQFLFFTIFLLLVLIPKNTLRYLTKRQPQHLANFYKGLIWNIKH